MYKIRSIHVLANMYFESMKDRTDMTQDAIKEILVNAHKDKILYKNCYIYSLSDEVRGPSPTLLYLDSEPKGNTVRDRFQFYCQNQNRFSMNMLTIDLESQFVMHASCKDLTGHPTIPSIDQYHRKILLSLIETTIEKIRVEPHTSYANMSN